MAATDAIILFSHGSLLCGAGEPLRRIAQHMRERGDAPTIEIGYLNYSEPPFDVAVDRCIVAGASRIVVAPYFLVPGKFVTADLPPAIARAAARHPQVEICTAPPLGVHPALAAALMQCAACAIPPAQWRDLQRTAPQFCRATSACPLYGTERCPATNEGEAPPEVTGRRAPAALDIQNVKTALIIMVHGSPRAESNDTMYEVANMVRSSGQFATVEAGFLECNTPTIGEAIDRCAANGVARIVAVPYFLHAGKHVVADLPTLLEAGMRRHPGLEFLLGDFLGHDLAIADVLRDRVKASL